MTNATSSASPLEPWLAEWPTVRAGVDELVISLKRRQLVGSYETAKRVMMLLSQMLETVNWHTASEITDKVRSLGHMLTKAHPHELAIGNVVRRVLFIIREEHENASKTSPETDAKAPTSSSSRSYQSRSLGSILTPGTDADLSTPIADLKLSVMEGIAELIDEIDSLHVTIADQAMEYIHTHEVILTYGQSTSVEEFLKNAAKKRDFKVIVVESAPSLNGQAMAHSLAASGLDVTLIPDSAVFAMMARVNKVVIPAAAVVANGGLIAQSGLQNIALAAKKCSVPVVCVAGLIKLCPLYAHDLDVVNELVAPSNIYNYEDTVENLEVLNPAYDYVPPEFVTLYITNTGAHQPSYIYRLLAEYYSPQDYQLACSVFNSSTASVPTSLTGRGIMRSAASLSLATKAAAQIDALVALSRDSSVSSSSCAQHAELLARALALVSQRHVVAAPTRAQKTTLAALDELKTALQQHQLLAAEQEGEYDAQHQELLQAGLLALWANVATYELLVALADLIMAVDFVPHALRFWKMQRRRPLRATIQNGPFEWVQPENVRITIDERIYSLESTLNATLEKLGDLKDLTTRIWATAPDESHELRGLVTEAARLLEHAYDSSGIVPPRRGKGAFKTLSPLDFSRIRFEPCVTSQPGTAKVTGASVLLSLDKLHTNLERFENSRTQFVSCFKTAMAPCVVPSKLRQRWLHLTVTAACIFTGGVWVLRNQREFQEALKTAKAATNEFLTEHMIEPMQAIVAELILNQKPEIQDAAALQDTKDSLRRMLGEFAKEKNPNMPSSELQRVLRDMDMSVVSLQYEKELGSAVRNLMSGDIVRMLLIQVQFIKKELMVAMGAIDELMHANQLNLQMLATIPTFLLFGGMYTLAKEIFYQVYKRTSERLYYDPGEIAGFFRNILRDIERLLNKQNRVTELDENVLDARDMGLLLLLLHQLRDVFDSNRELFDEDEQQRFDEDLNDLIEEGLLVTQQLSVIQRMYHSHPFLQRTKNVRWLLN